MRTPIIAALVFFALPSAAVADPSKICVDTRQVAELWHDLAYVVHETKAEGFNPGEIHDIADIIGEISEVSGQLATLLKTEGNDTQARIGQQLEIALAEFAELTGAAKAEHAVQAVDQVVAAIDVVCHQCDHGTEAH